MFAPQTAAQKSLPLLSWVHRGAHAEVVLPDGRRASSASSWPCLNTFDRAKPRPSSRMDLVKTPTIVDFPESTFPITATRISMEQAPSVACLRARMSVLSPPACKMLLQTCQGLITLVALCRRYTLVQALSGVLVDACCSTGGCACLDRANLKVLYHATTHPCSPSRAQTAQALQQG